MDINKENSQKVTIVILTLNRPKLLLRTVKFFASYGINCIVADGSSEQEVADLTDLFENCKHLHMPDHDSSRPMGNYAERMKIALESITTEYAMLCADDEFRSPSSISKAIDLLDKNKDLVGVYGSVTKFKVEKDGEIKFLPAYSGLGRCDLTDPEGSERVKVHFKHYQPAAHFSVLRTRQLRLAYGFGLAIEPPVFAFAELMTEFGILLTGRLLFLDEVMVFRSTENNKIPRKRKVCRVENWWFSDQSAVEKEVLFRSLEELVRNSDTNSIVDEKELLEVAMTNYINRRKEISHKKNLRWRHHAVRLSRRLLGVILGDRAKNLVKRIINNYGNRQAVSLHFSDFTEIQSAISQFEKENAAEQVSLKGR